MKLQLRLIEKIDEGERLFFGGEKLKGKREILIMICEWWMVDGGHPTSHIKY